MYKKIGLYIVLFLLTIIGTLRTLREGSDVLNAVTTPLVVASIIGELNLIWKEIKRLQRYKGNLQRKKDVNSYFVNREKERETLLNEVNRIIGTKEKKIFYITGTEGCGKTELLRKFVEDVNCKDSLFDGDMELSKLKKKFRAYYVNLEGFRDIRNVPGLVEAIVKSINIDPDISDAQGLMDSLKPVSWLKKNYTILILDNFNEHQRELMKEFARAINLTKSNPCVIMGFREKDYDMDDAFELKLFDKKQIRLLCEKYGLNLSSEQQEEMLEFCEYKPHCIRFIFHSLRNGEKYEDIIKGDDLKQVILKLINSLKSEEKELLVTLSFLTLLDERTINQKSLINILDICDTTINTLVNHFFIQKENDQVIKLPSEFIVDALSDGYTERKVKEITEKLSQKKLSQDIMDKALLISNAKLSPKQVQEIFNSRKGSKTQPRDYQFFSWVGNVYELNKSDEYIIKLNAIFTANERVKREMLYYYFDSMLKQGFYKKTALSFKKIFEDGSGFLPLGQENSEFDYDMQCLYIDLLHLTNNFSQAIIESRILLEHYNKSKISRKQSFKYERQYLITHCEKHLGQKLDQAKEQLEIMYQNFKKDFPGRMTSENVDLYAKISYSILSIEIFKNNKGFPYKIHFDEIEDLQKQFPKNSRFHYALRHLASYYWMNSRDWEKSLEVVNSCIKELEKTRDRILYNFYFERAEYKRLSNEIQNEENYSITEITDDYQRALRFADENEDINLLTSTKMAMILLELSTSLHDEKWVSEKLSEIKNIQQKLEDIACKDQDSDVSENIMSINNSYALYIEKRLKKDPITEDQINHWKKLYYIDLVSAVEHNVPLKLTVM